MITPNCSLPHVRALICHRDIDLGILCLGSLYRFSADPLKIVLHDDGSLTTADRSRLLDALPNVILISREEADAVILPLLRNYPRCLAYRMRNPLGMRLIDAAYFAQGDIIFADTDVLFLRPFKGAFRWPSDAVQSVFLCDCFESFCLRPWQTRGLSIRSRYNAGLMMIRRQHFDLMTMEKLVETIETNPGFSKNSQWLLEQTCWAAISSRLEARRWKPQQMRVIEPQAKYNEALVAGHFCGSVRPLLYRFKEQAKASGVADRPPVEIGFTPAYHYSTPRFLAIRAVNSARRIRSWVRRWRFLRA
jgi:hypothetical protein